MTLLRLMEVEKQLGRTYEFFNKKYWLLSLSFRNDILIFKIFGYNQF